MNDIAATILAQLSPQGARGLKIMLGAAILADTPNSVTLRFKGSRTLNHAEISLNGRDTYDMTLGRTGPDGKYSKGVPPPRPLRRGPPARLRTGHRPHHRHPPDHLRRPITHPLSSTSPDAKIMLHSVTKSVMKDAMTKKTPIRPLLKGGWGKKS